MRTLKFALVLFVIVIPVVVFSVANAEVVTVRLWPDLTDYGLPLSPSVETPVFMVGLVAGLIWLLVGIAFGLGYEYVREGKIRRSAREAKREADALRKKLDEIAGDSDDDVAALPAR